jgi:hypothetical protein
MYGTLELPPWEMAARAWDEGYETASETPSDEEVPDDPPDVRLSSDAVQLRVAACAMVLAGAWVACASYGDVSSKVDEFVPKESVVDLLLADLTF